MEVFKTLLFFSDFDQDYPHLVKTIRVGNSWWLIGKWLEVIATGERIPERLVRLDGLPHQEVENQPYRFVLNAPIPKAVLDGEDREGFVTATHPAVALLKATSKSVH
jgi:hypothetical protein